MRNSLFPSILFACVIALAALLFWHSAGRVTGLLVSTALLALGAMSIALPWGTVLAVCICKTNIGGRTTALAALTAMLFVPLYIVAGAWDAGFGMQGWYTMLTNPRLEAEPLLVGWRAAIWIHAVAAVPWVVLIVGAALRTVEPELEEDAALDAPPARVLWSVSLRRARTAIALAALWVAIVCAAEISVTDLFQVRTFAEEIYTQSALGTLELSLPISPTAPLEPIQISPAGLWLGLLVLLLLAVGALAAAHRVFWPQIVDPPTRPQWVAHLARGRITATLVTWACLALLVGVPLLNLVYKAGIEVRLAENERVRTWSATKALSLLARAPIDHQRELGKTALLGVAAATAAVLVAGLLAWSLRRANRTPWLRLALLGLCLVVPGPMLGIAVIHVLNQPPDSPLAFLAPLYDSHFAPWLVQSVRALPVATLILWPALASVPQSTLDSAASEGAGPLLRLFLVALPQRWSAGVAAWLLALAIAIGELSATVLVVPPGTTTIAVNIFLLLHYGVDDRVAAICLLLVICVALVTLMAARLLRGGAKLPSV